MPSRLRFGFAGDGAVGPHQALRQRRDEQLGVHPRLGRRAFLARLEPAEPAERLEPFEHQLHLPARPVEFADAGGVEFIRTEAGRVPNDASARDADSDEACAHPFCGARPQPRRAFGSGRLHGRANCGLIRCADSDARFELRELHSPSRPVVEAHRVSGQAHEIAGASRLKRQQIGGAAVGAIGDGERLGAAEVQPGVFAHARIGEPHAHEPPGAQLHHRVQKQFRTGRTRPAQHRGVNGAQRAGRHRGHLGTISGDMDEQEVQEVFGRDQPLMKGRVRNPVAGRRGSRRRIKEGHPARRIVEQGAQEVLGAREAAQALVRAPLSGDRVKVRRKKGEQPFPGGDG